MRSKSNALLNAVREDDGASMLAPNELADMVLELAALIADAAPYPWHRHVAMLEAESVERIGEAMRYRVGGFVPLRWSPLPDESVICAAVCELYPVRYEDGPNAYVIVAPRDSGEESYVMRELLFALRVLRRLAWLRVEGGA